MNKLSSRGRLFLAAATVAAGLLCLTVVIIPVAEVAGFPAAPWFRLALRPACHQISDRCLDLGNGPLAVCARCAGLYAGGFLGLLVTTVGGRRFRPSWKTVAFAATPSIIDFVLGQIGLPSLSNWPRFYLALAPGFLLGLLLADAISTATRSEDESISGPIT